MVNYMLDPLIFFYAIAYTQYYNVCSMERCTYITGTYATHLCGPSVAGVQ